MQIICSANHTSSGFRSQDRRIVSSSAALVAFLNLAPERPFTRCAHSVQVAWRMGLPSTTLKVQNGRARCRSAPELRTVCCASARSCRRGDRGSGPDNRQRAGIQGDGLLDGRTNRRFRPRARSRDADVPAHVVPGDVCGHLTRREGVQLLPAAPDSVRRRLWPSSSRDASSRAPSRSDALDDVRRVGIDRRRDCA